MSGIASYLICQQFKLLGGTICRVYDTKQSGKRIDRSNNERRVYRILPITCHARRSDNVF